MTLVRILVALSASLGASAHATCACQCIEGAPRTLCTTVEEAARNPALCGRNPPVCEGVAPPEHIERFEPPPGAIDCRAARLWDPGSDAYAIAARVCRPDETASAQPPAR